MMEPYRIEAIEYKMQMYKMFASLPKITASSEALN